MQKTRLIIINILFININLVYIFYNIFRRRAKGKIYFTLIGLAGQGSEISNQILEELFYLRDFFNQNLIFRTNQKK